MHEDSSEQPDAPAAGADSREQSIIPITVAHGDGIGPEIMESVMRILDAAGAPLRYDVIEIGQKVYEQGESTGIPPEAWDIIRRNRVFLKAPITTPQGGGYKSLNVTIRKSLSLFANVRPSKSFAPFVASPHPTMNLIIIRENEEDLYAGIEHRQTLEVAQVLKLITRPGSERIVRYAFEYARHYGRSKVTCMTKDNIMKLTDGLFHQVFREVSEEYPEIESEHNIIDIGAARLAAQPERFDVIVTPNLYGDILSDIASQIAGSVGLSGSANIGEKIAMFEAIHGSAPDIGGRGIANPSGLLMAATEMLVHIDQPQVAEKIHDAWLYTLESGDHTADIYRPGLSNREVDTEQFTQAVIDNLGKEPRHLQREHYRTGGIHVKITPTPQQKKELVGVDVFLDWPTSKEIDTLGEGVTAAGEAAGWRLKMITNRGVKVYPEGMPEIFCTDHWRCRFVVPGEETTSFPRVLELLRSIHDAGFEVIKTEHLYNFDGERGYSLGQGE
jgi:isocitrate dehydrogenase